MIRKKCISIIMAAFMVIGFTLGGAAKVVPPCTGSHDFEFVEGASWEEIVGTSDCCYIQHYGEMVQCTKCGYTEINSIEHYPVSGHDIGAGSRCTVCGIYLGSIWDK